MKSRSPIAPLPQAAPDRAALIMACVGLAALLLAYVPFLRGGFILDDVSLLALNPALGLANLGDFFTHSLWYNSADRLTGDGVYRPLTLVWYTLVRGAVGASPLGFHLVNLALLALNGALVAALAGRLVPQTSAETRAAAGTLYVLHPAHVQTVLWAVGGAESLCVAFCLLSVLAFFAYRENGRRRLLAASLACFAAALLVKETAVALPVLLLLGPATGGVSVRERAKATGWHLLVLAGYGAARTIAVQVPPVAFTPASLSHLAEITVLSLRHLVLPWPQPFYAVPPPQGSMHTVDAVVAGVAAVTLIAAVRNRRLRPAVAWFCVAWLPTVGLALMANGVFALRYLALPLAGAAIGVAVFTAGVTPSKAVARSAFAVLLALCVIGIAAEAPAWRDEGTFGRKMLRFDPASTLAYDAMARQAKLTGDSDALLAVWSELSTQGTTEEIRCKALEVLGYTARELTRAQTSLDAFHRLESCPSPRQRALGAVGVGNFLWMEGRLETALEAYERAALAEPGNFLALYNRANLLETLGRTAAAIPAYEKVLSLPHQGDWDADAAAHAREFLDHVRKP